MEQPSSDVEGAFGLFGAEGNDGILLRGKARGDETCDEREQHRDRDKQHGGHRREHRAEAGNAGQVVDEGVDRKDQQYGQRSDPQ